MVTKNLVMALCLWHTTLVYKHHLRKYVDLVDRPKIGKKVHLNGLLWKVKKTELVCAGPKIID